MKTAQRRVARPMIARMGGTHRVDLAVNPDDAVRDMEHVYTTENENGERESVYRPKVDDRNQLNPNRPGMAWPFGRACGAGEVLVTDTAIIEDGAYQNEDVQPEPSEADGEEQNMGGAQDDEDDKTTRADARRGFYNPRYSRRSGGIG